MACSVQHLGDILTQLLPQPGEHQVHRSPRRRTAAIVRVTGVACSRIATRYRRSTSGIDVLQGQAGHVRPGHGPVPTANPAQSESIAGPAGGAAAVTRTIGPVARGRMARSGPRGSEILVITTSASPPCRAGTLSCGSSPGVRPPARVATRQAGHRRDRQCADGALERAEPHQRPVPRRGRAVRPRRCPCGRGSPSPVLPAAGRRGRGGWN